MKKTIIYLFITLSSTVFGQTFGGGVTDIDGNSYASVIIGDQEWMAENLRVSKFANGDPIPNVSTSGDWYQLNTPAFCWYDNDSINYNSINGKLYNWYVVNDTRDVCPIGWRVPNDNDWDTLKLFISSNGYNGIEGHAMKSLSGWNNNGNGTDDFNFNALPSGFRFDDNNSTFNSVGSMAYFWSSSSGINYDAMYRKLEDVADTIRTNDGTAKYGFSIRCMKDYTGSGVGIIENTFKDQFTLYPNPTNGLFAIEFNTTHENVALKILEASGRIIDNKNYNQVDLIEYELNEPDGVYVIELVSSKGQRSLIRLIKQ